MKQPDELALGVTVFHARTDDGFFWQHDPHVELFVQGSGWWGLSVEDAKQLRTWLAAFIEWAEEVER